MCLHLYGGASVAFPTDCGLGCRLKSGCERLVLPQPKRNPLSSELLVSRQKSTLAGDVKMEMSYHPRWIRKWEEREALGSGHGTLPLSETCPPGTYSTAMAMNTRCSRRLTATPTALLRQEYFNLRSPQIASPPSGKLRAQATQYGMVFSTAPRSRNTPIPVRPPWGLCSAVPPPVPLLDAYQSSF